MKPLFYVAKKGILTDKCLVIGPIFQCFEHRANDLQMTNLAYVNHSNQSKPSTCSINMADPHESVQTITNTRKIQNSTLTLLYIFLEQICIAFLFVTLFFQHFLFIGKSLALTDMTDIRKAEEAGPMPEKVALKAEVDLVSEIFNYFRIFLYFKR